MNFVVALILGFLSLCAGSTSEGLRYLEDNSLKEGVITLSSGLQYRVLSSGNGKHPNLTTTCLCNYKGQTIDGIEFDSSYSRGTPSSFSPNQVIAGWREALLLMKEGDHWELVIPSELAYGEKNVGSVITSGAVLIFELHFLEIDEKNTETPLNTFRNWFGGGPPIWMLLTLYFSYILLFRVGPYIKNSYFPGKVMKKVTPEDAASRNGNSRVYLDIKIGDASITKRIEFTLFDSIVPKTAENFRELCTGSRGLGQAKKPLHFANSLFHRIIPGFM